MNWKILCVTALSFGSFLNAETTKTPSTQLPEMPSVETKSPSQAESFLPSATESTLPSTKLPQQTVPKLTKEEQQEQLKKEKNWLLEGLKEKEAKAEAERLQNRNEKSSIIDDILERNSQQLSETQKTQELSTNRPEGEQQMFQPSITTSAWEPLPDPKNNSANSFSIKEPESTDPFSSSGAAGNVFYNPKTGSFESRPVDYSKLKAVQANSDFQQWQERQQRNWSTAGTSVEQEVSNFEKNLVQQAKAEKKLPENYTINNSSDAFQFNPSLKNNSGSPYLFGKQNQNSRGTTNFSQQQASFSSQQANQSAVTRLRMMEEQRLNDRRKIEQPKVADIHSGVKIPDINPRFN